MIDSHAHLQHGGVFDDDLDDVLARAREAGVTGILNVATSTADAGATIACARRYPEVWAAVGIHPHSAAEATPESVEALVRLAADPRVVAWGEIGLDYHYAHAPLATQREALALQLEAAARLRLPVSVHSREAEADTVEILSRHAGEPRGVIHCFTGDWPLARACLDLGFMLSFSGIVTFRNAGALREVARRVPEDRLLVETDSPFLAPEPGRGGRNEPARVRQVIDRLAEERACDPEALASATTANFHRLIRCGPGFPCRSEPI